MLTTINKALQSRIDRGLSAQVENSRKSLVRMEVKFSKVNKKQQTVTGQVYSPYVLDSHLEMMEPEDVEHMCHHWVKSGMNSYDVMHDNNVIDATTLESWIARGHPDWDEGAWVVTMKINDLATWKRVESGDLGGFSVEAWAVKAETYVEYTTSPVVFGFTEEHDGHVHAFVAFVNEKGVVTGGFTSKVNGHKHIIEHGTRTGRANKHAHRYLLP